MEMDVSLLFLGVCTNIMSGYKAITNQFKPWIVCNHLVSRFCLISSVEVGIVRLSVIWIIGSGWIGSKGSSDSFWNRRRCWQVGTLRMKAIFVGRIFYSDGSAIWRGIRKSTLDNLERGVYRIRGSLKS